MFSEISHRKTPSPQACNFVKKETPAQVFSSGSCEFSKNIFSYRTPPVAAFLYACYKKNKIRNLLRWTYKHRSRKFREIQKSFEKEDNIWTYGLKNSDICRCKILCDNASAEHNITNSRKVWKTVDLLFVDKVTSSNTIKFVERGKIIASQEWAAKTFCMF